MEIKADAYLKIQDKVLLRQLQVFGTCTWVAEAARLKMEENKKNTVKTQLMKILIFSFKKLIVATDDQCRHRFPIQHLHKI
jgi:hypothetical protein